MSEHSLSHLERQTRIGLGFTLVVALSLLSWAAFAQISGAVIAPGQVTVEGSVKQI
ncbi:hypothetical protein MMA231_01670 [Asticcacaulis sp. MM231]|uniref:hypothetical protein n=1 Tax=Asticcacaulis sp. MM231 TaxID=3157666 RepID=UPI0032D59BEF